MPLRATTRRAATLLVKNPALFCRIALAKLNTARPMPRLPARRQIGDIVFECDLRHYRGTAPMYFGSYALLVIQAMERILKPGGVFFDVGANIGYLSAVGAKLVGTRGEVHSFEPIPDYHARLRRLAHLNPNHTIVANRCSVGETREIGTIYVTREPGQNTMVPNYQSRTEITSTLQVPVMRLDSYIEERGLRKISLIKIDAEGFELPILKGMQKYFESSPDRPPILCEIAPRAYSLLGRSLADLANYMANYGYASFDLIDGSTPVNIHSLTHVEDVLFLSKRGA
jgi:FkbM family methyltransferase